MFDSIEELHIAKPRGKRTTAVRLPEGCWPFQMTADLAAAFAGETSVETFRSRCGVPDGYPKGRRLPGGSREFWLRPSLEQAIIAMHSEETGLSAASYL